METTPKRKIVWFSCGVASAVAACFALIKYPSALVVYCDTMNNEHKDNARFLEQVQAWLARPIHVIRSATYQTIEQVFESTRYMSGIAGARCTTEMKKLPREAFQRESDTHIFGYTIEERKRAESFDDRNQSLHTEWILIDSEISKGECHAIIAKAGILQPEMYRLGFEHNNCIGCVKSSSTGYWNLTRRLFPDIFASRCEQSRRIGCKLIRVNGKREYLDALPTDSNDPQDNIDCGPVCQMRRED